MKKKGIIGIILTFVILFIIFLLFKNNFLKIDNKTKVRYIIGCSAPLTGEGANYGRSVKEGVDLAIEQINQQKFLNKPLIVDYEDDKMNPKDGVNAVNKLIITDKVPIIIGPFGSSIVMATAPIAEKNKTIIISASATADAIKNAGDYVFRITPQNSKQGSDIAIFCIDKLKLKKAAILYQNNDYGLTLKDAFEKKYNTLGGIITSAQGVILNTTDLKTQLLKIKEEKPDVVFFPLHYQECGIMLKQAQEIGLKAKFISADGAMTDDMLKQAGLSAEGTFYSTLALGFGKADNEIVEFNNSFKNKYKKDADIYNAYYYEVTWLIAKAIKNNGFKTENIKNYLYSLNGNNCYQGITGNTCFDNYGEVDKSFYIYIVKDGKYQLFK